MRKKVLERREFMDNVSKRMKLRMCRGTIYVWMLEKHVLC